MDQSTLLLYISLSLLSLLLAFKLFLRSKNRRRLHLPPSPPSYPIIGHLHLIKHPVFRALHKLSEKYGPVISLRFGSRLVVVVSSPSAVQECFTKNDIILANRPGLTATKKIAYNGTTVSAAPYGEHWRNLRRLCAIEIFSSSRLNQFSAIRRDEVKRLLEKLSKNSFSKFAKVEMQSKLSELSYNIMMREIAGKRYYGDDVSDMEEAEQFRDLMRQIVSFGGASRPEDYLPILRWIDPKGNQKKIAVLSKKSDDFLQGLINDQRNKSKEMEMRTTMIDHLLSLQETEPEYYSDQIIKGLILIMLVAGTDTSAVTLEWALAHLLNNPEVLKKARAELDSQTGQDRLVEESDMSKLPYLRAIIFETLRLTPAAPLLVPHYSSEDCTIEGYDVPRNTIVLINAWAIHRDPNHWEDATAFKPERFENGEAVESHKLLPFGLGRRACPGASHAQRVVSLALASLIQCFEWEREDDEEEIDMAEAMGTVMHKVVPLQALCKARPILNKVIAE